MTRGTVLLSLSRAVVVAVTVYWGTTVTVVLTQPPSHLCYVYPLVIFFFHLLFSLTSAQLPHSPPRQLPPLRPFPPTPYCSRAAPSPSIKCNLFIDSDQRVFWPRRPAPPNCSYPLILTSFGHHLRLGSPPGLPACPIVDACLYMCVCV